MNLLKRTMAILALAVLSAPVSLAQADYRNDVSLSLGIASVSDIYNLFTKAMTSLVDGLTEVDVDFASAGSISAEYFHRMNDVISLGGIVSYNNLSVIEDGQVSRKVNYYSLLPAVKFQWYQREKFGTYSKVAVGATLKTDSTVDPSLRMSFHISLLGLEVGKRVRAFTEFGIGEQGLLVLGLRYRF